MNRKIIFCTAGVLMVFIFLQGCYYHKADQVYPSTGGCDTTNVRYSVEITAILDANCKSCHFGDAPISGFDLYDHTVISTLALDGHFTYGTLLSAVMHEGGAPFMPQNALQLQQCDINKIAAWVHSGAPNN
jgi:hypothetical protein